MKNLFYYLIISVFSLHIFAAAKKLSDPVLKRCFTSAFHSYKAEEDDQKRKRLEYIKAFSSSLKPHIESELKELNIGIFIMGSDGRKEGFREY